MQHTFKTLHYHAIIYRRKFKMKVLAVAVIAMMVISALGKLELYCKFYKKSCET